MAMEESVLDIKLMNGPGVGGSNAEDSPDGGGLTTGLKVSS